MSQIFKRDVFFAQVRPVLFGGFVGTAGPGQIAGLDAILSEWENRGGGDTRQLAYMLATAFLETNHTMQPVREAYWLSEAWRKTHLRYFPWYGRGLVQLTWQQNYTKADRLLSLGGAQVANPDLALSPAVAVRIMFDGMAQGWFTGKKLSDFILGGLCSYEGARRIINGTDRAAECAGYARTFEAALRAAMQGTVTMGAAPVAPTVILTPSQPAIEKPMPPMLPEHKTTAGAIAAVSTVAAGVAVQQGAWWMLAAGLVGLIAVAAVVLYQHRAQVAPRAKEIVPK